MVSLVMRRQKQPCPLFVEINEWNGRLGNQLHQMGQALIAAELCGIRSVRFPPHIKGRHYHGQDGLLDAPREVMLPGLDRHSELQIPEQCPIEFIHNWYHKPCYKIPAREYRRVMLKHVEPALGNDIAECLRANRSAIEDDLLTVHLRNDDIGQYVYMFWGQPPCSMYEKIISEEKFKKVIVVGAGQGPCQTWFREFAKKQRITLREQSGTVAEDFCALARARHLVLSFSSFSVSAALVSREVRAIYRRKDSAWDGRSISAINCDVWPGVKMLEYGLRAQAKQMLDKADQARLFVTTFPLKNISGPFVCCSH